jgi:small subunit ribosomal protein S16
MQRTGRKGHAQFRVIVQESRLTPTSGRVVALLGSYDPHTKVATLDKEKATTYLSNGAQPSDRVARLLQKEGVTLPSWVTATTVKESKIRHPEKLRRNRPEEPKEEVAEVVEAEASVEPVEAEAPAAEDTVAPAQA